MVEGGPTALLACVMYLVVARKVVGTTTLTGRAPSPIGHPPTQKKHVLLVSKDNPKVYT